MSRGLVFLIVLVALLVGALFLFSGMAKEKPPVPVEKVIKLENLAQ